MRKVLLGTTALVAAGLLVATTAQAQDEEEMMMAEPITASISGYYNMAFIAMSSDNDDGVRGHGIDHNAEIQVSGSTTLDNGITVSVGIDFRPNGVYDTANVTLSGGFGSLAYGAISSAARGTPGAPWGNALFNVNGAWFGNGIDTGGGDGSGFTDKAQKIVYTSPNFNGFTLGASYAPEGTKGYYPGRANNQGEQGQQIAFGLGFSQAVMGGNFSAGVTQESHTTEANADGDACVAAAAQCDPGVLRAGASISIDNISIGGGYVQTDQNAGNELTLQNAGVAYSMGNIAIDLGWASSSNDMTGDDSDYYSLGLGMNLGPGVDVAAAIQAGTDSFGAANTPDNDWTAVLIGTSVNF
jgi:predicted porin